MARKPNKGEAVGAASRSVDPTRAQRVEQAMAQAAARAQASGVTDPNEIRAAMLAARDDVLKE